MNIFLPPAHFQDAITLSILKKKKEVKNKEDKNCAVILHNMVNIA